MRIDGTPERASLDLWGLRLPTTDRGVNGEDQDPMGGGADLEGMLPRGPLCNWATLEPRLPAEF